MTVPSTAGTKEYLQKSFVTQSNEEKHTYVLRGMTDYDISTVHNGAIQALEFNLKQ